MSIRKAVICASIALSAAALPAQAQVTGAIEIEVAPPPPRVEVVPAPREGYVWAPGYWRWEEPQHTHVWVEGRYVQERRGFKWIADRWHHRGERKYYYEEGHYERVN